MDALNKIIVYRILNCYLTFRMSVGKPFSICIKLRTSRQRFRGKMITVSTELFSLKQKIDIPLAGNKENLISCILY